jgi:hypothetical protein
VKVVSRQRKKKSSVEKEDEGNRDEASTTSIYHQIFTGQRLKLLPEQPPVPLMPTSKQETG